jgi:hypothetical protein
LPFAAWSSSSTSTSSSSSTMISVVWWARSDTTGRLHCVRDFDVLDRLHYICLVLLDPYRDQCCSDDFDHKLALVTATFILQQRPAVQNSFNVWIVEYSVGRGAVKMHFNLFLVLKSRDGLRQIAKR